MEKRVWIKSGIVEELDAKQVRLINLVLEKSFSITDTSIARDPATGIP